MVLAVRLQVHHQVALPQEVPDVPLPLHQMVQGQEVQVVRLQVHLLVVLLQAEQVIHLELRLRPVQLIWVEVLREEVAQNHQLRLQNLLLRLNQPLLSLVKNNNKSAQLDL
jgi:hypothetical protein